MSSTNKYVYNKRTKNEKKNCGKLMFWRNYLHCFSDQLIKTWSRRWYFEIGKHEIKSWNEVIAIIRVIDMLKYDVLFFQQWIFTFPLNWYIDCISQFCASFFKKYHYNWLFICRLMKTMEYSMYNKDIPLQRWTLCIYRLLM